MNIQELHLVIPGTGGCTVLHRVFEEYIYVVL